MRIDCFAGILSLDFRRSRKSFYVKYSSTLWPERKLSINEMSSRTVERYRRLFREKDVAFNIMQQVTQTLVSKLELSVKEQHLDSTHLFSNMAQWGQTKLLREVNLRFLKQFKRHEQTAYNQLPALWQTFRDMKRVFTERCEKVDGLLKPKTKISCKALQNPSDPDVGYSGHKGIGYHVQVAETCDDVLMY